MISRLPSCRAPLNFDPNDWIVCAAAGEHFAFPLEWVEAITAPPPVAPVPHARQRSSERETLAAASYRSSIRRDSSGARAGGRRMTERQCRMPARRRRQPRAVGRTRGAGDAGPAAGATGERGDYAVDPAQLATACLAPPPADSGPAVPLGEVAELAAPLALGELPETFLVVEAAQRQFYLRRDAVLELLDDLPWVTVPRAPPGVLGVGLLRGAALPVLSLAALLGLPADGAPGAFVGTLVRERHLLLGVSRLVGLRPVAAAPPLDPDALVSDELRRIVLGFPAVEGAAPRACREGSDPDRTVSVLRGCRARLCPAHRRGRPRRPAAAAGTHRPDRRRASARRLPARWSCTGRSYLSHRCKPPCRGRRRRAAATPSAYVIVRSSEGPCALGVDRINQVIRLRPRASRRRPPMPSDRLPGSRRSRAAPSCASSRPNACGAEDARRRKNLRGLGTARPRRRRSGLHAHRAAPDRRGRWRYAVVGEARNGEAACALAKELQPNVVTMDVEMPVMDGIEATRRILAEVRPAPVMIMVSSHTQSGAAATIEALRLGAADFVSKESTFAKTDLGHINSELRAKIRAVHGAAPQGSTAAVAPTGRDGAAPAGLILHPSSELCGNARRSGPRGRSRGDGSVDRRPLDTDAPCSGRPERSPRRS